MQKKLLFIAFAFVIFASGCVSNYEYDSLGPPKTNELDCNALCSLMGGKEYSFKEEVSGPMWGRALCFCLSKQHEIERYAWMNEKGVYVKI